MDNNEIELRVARDFISANWVAFEDHCEELGEDARQIYEAIGGEEEE